MDVAERYCDDIVDDGDCFCSEVISVIGNGQVFYSAQLGRGAARHRGADQQGRGANGPVERLV